MPFAWIDGERRVEVGPPALAKRGQHVQRPVVEVTQVEVTHLGPK